MIIEDIIRENNERNEEIRSIFNPITGEGSILDRVELHIEDFPIQLQYVPKDMLSNKMVHDISNIGSISSYLTKKGIQPTSEAIELTGQTLVRIRCQCDFPFFAAMYVYIKAKGGGEDILFRLNRPQRKLITTFEEKRIAGMPIRVILLKARQWGGSTATQMYMVWLQLMHRTGLNSLIIGHVKDVSTEVRDMFHKMIEAYPLELLYTLGEDYNPKDPKIAGVGQTGNIHRIPQRNCKIKVGTAEKPNSCRGGDYNLVHCTEVGLWKTTENKTPEEIVRSATSGVLNKPYTMIVYESTANGTGNFFHREYEAAKEGNSQFTALFISWYEIEAYSLPIEKPKEFAQWLLDNKDNNFAQSYREEPGKYLRWLWEQGATLEAINWYVTERTKYVDHGDIASEFPSDDIEAFTHSGDKVFDRYKVENLRKTCTAPKFVGDIYADDDKGERSLAHVRFTEDRQGLFCVWSLPEKDEEDCIITDRYLVVVDIGGRSNKADWSVIVVFDRLFMMEGGNPSVVAQWYGHIAMDLLAWKAAQIASFYNNALLVIESNTLETKDRERIVDGDQSQFILNQVKVYYDNLYARKQSEDEIREGAPRKYGFHTNVAPKPLIISTLIKVVREGLYVERDTRCIDEYLTYEKKKNGAFGAISGKHDDLLMTRAIGLHICFNEMSAPQMVIPSMNKSKQTKTTMATF